MAENVIGNLINHKRMLRMLFIDIENTNGRNRSWQWLDDRDVEPQCLPAKLFHLYSVKQVSLKSCFTGRRDGTRF